MASESVTQEMFTEKTTSVLAKLDSSSMLLGDELDEQETNLTTLVPEECVSILIGKAGSNINTLKSATGASISFAKKENSIQGLRKCFHTGTIAQIARAVFVEVTFIAEAAGGPAAVSIVVNHNAAGAVIGKGGENLKGIREHTGCHVSMEKAQEATPAMGGRCLSLRHTDSADQVSNAIYRTLRVPSFASPTQAESRSLSSAAADPMAYDPNASYGYGPAGSQHESKRYSPYGAVSSDVCALHGKKRGKQNLQPHPQVPGQFICLENDQCKGAANPMMAPSPYGAFGQQQPAMGMMGGMGPEYGQRPPMSMGAMGAMNALNMMGGMYGIDPSSHCALHGKKRGPRNLQPHPTQPGLFICITGDECKGAGIPAGVAVANPANTCSLHGKKRGAQNLQPHPTTPGAFVCLDSDQCK